VIGPDPLDRPRRYVVISQADDAFRLDLAAADGIDPDDVDAMNDLCEWQREFDRLRDALRCAWRHGGFIRRRAGRIRPADTTTALEQDGWGWDAWQLLDQGGRPFDES
jgi:hypothetical protein